MCERNGRLTAVLEELAFLVIFKLSWCSIDQHVGVSLFTFAKLHKIGCTSVDVDK